MILQAFEGLSDREATDRLGFDLRWQAAAGVAIGAEAFHPTVLVGARNRLRASVRPRRLFEDTKVVAKATGALGQRARVLDSTPIFDAVATEDTVTQLRAVIRKLLVAFDQAGDPLAGRGARRRFSATTSTRHRESRRATGTTGQPERPSSTPSSKTPTPHSKCSVTTSSKERRRPLPSCSPSSPARTSPKDDDGVFRIVRGVAKDRVISTVDTEARHGHKSKNRHFDGYKAHISIDPDSELIAEIVATPANTHDRRRRRRAARPTSDGEDKPIILGDSAYADGQTRRRLSASRASPLMAKCPPIRNATGGFTKERFVDRPRGQHRHLPGRTGRRRSPDEETAAASPASLRTARAVRCAAACTTSRAGRSVAINEHEAILQQARAEQTRSGVDRHLSGEPTTRRAQDRPSRPTRLGWTTRTDPRTATHRHRSRHESGRDQLGASRDTRADLRSERMDARRGLKRSRPNPDRKFADQKWGISVIADDKQSKTTKGATYVFERLTRARTSALT